jgi:hypothetical protein
MVHIGIRRGLYTIGRIFSSLAGVIGKPPLFLGNPPL